jgi:hypothetical protein
MKITIPTVLTRSAAGRENHIDSNHVLRIGNTRYGLGGWTAEGTGRIVYQGPMVKGPYVFVFGLATVIASNPSLGTGAERQRNLLAGTEHDVAEGDEVEFTGALTGTYRIKKVHREWTLEPVA